MADAPRDGERVGAAVAPPRVGAHVDRPVQPPRQQVHQTARVPPGEVDAVGAARGRGHGVWRGESEGVVDVREGELVALLIHIYIYNNNTYDIYIIII